MGKEIKESQKILFESTMENMKPCGRHGTGKFVCSIPVDLLRVDEAYQRISTRKEIALRRLARNWSDDKLMPIIVVPHEEEYSFYIIDGYGRYIVSTTMLPNLKYKALDAIVLTKVPKNYSERQKYEAQLFIGQGNEVETVTPVQMHNARLLAGDEAAIILQSMCDKHNISYVSNSGQRNGAVLGSYAVAYDIARINGRSCLDFIFSVIENAGWHTETNGYSRNVMKALKDIWTAHQSTSERNQAFTYLGEELRKTDPHGLIAKARAKYPERDPKQSTGLYIEDLLVDNLNFERAEYFIESKTIRLGRAC